MSKTPDITLYSFDVFDTSLARIVARPKDIFFLVQSEILRSDLRLPGKFVKNFPIFRLGAEFEARVLKRLNEITIEDIYSQMKKAHNIDNDQLVSLIRIEKDVERRSAYPIEWTRSQIDTLRKQNSRIIFTSDIYLPVETIKNMLIDTGLYKEGDGLYISSDIGLTKRSGALFKYILEKENCEECQVIHCGDDLHSDVYVPARMGMRIYQITEDEVKKLLRYHPMYLLTNYGKKIASAAFSALRTRMSL